MELKEQQLLDALTMIEGADGEDVERLIRAAGFEDYLLRALFMRISDDELNDLLEERYILIKEHKYKTR
jgi:hypothetical protein